MHYNYIQHTKLIYLSNFQIDTITNVEVIRQKVFSRAQQSLVFSYFSPIFFQLSQQCMNFHIRIFIYPYFVDLKCFISISEKTCNLCK